MVRGMLVALVSVFAGACWRSASLGEQFLVTGVEPVDSAKFENGVCTQVCAFVFSLDEHAAGSYRYSILDQCSPTDRTGARPRPVLAGGIVQPGAEALVQLPVRTSQYLLRYGGVVPGQLGSGSISSMEGNGLPITLARGGRSVAGRRFHDRHLDSLWWQEWRVTGRAANPPWCGTDPDSIKPPSATRRVDR